MENPYSSRVSLTHSHISIFNLGNLSIMQRVKTVLQITLNAYMCRDQLWDETVVDDYLSVTFYYPLDYL